MKIVLEYYVRRHHNSHKIDLKKEMRKNAAVSKGTLDFTYIWNSCSRGIAERKVTILNHTDLQRLGPQASKMGHLGYGNETVFTNNFQNVYYNSFYKP